MWPFVWTSIVSHRVLQPEATPVSVCANADSWNDYTGSVASSAVCESSGAGDQDHCCALHC